MSNTDINFSTRDLQWRFYIIRNVLLTIRQVELIEKKKFATATLDLKYKPFIVYIAVFNINLGNEMYSLKKSLIAFLKADKALIKVLSKYVNFVDVFLSKLDIELSNYMKINNPAIKLVDDWQLFYSCIYSLN